MATLFIAVFADAKEVALGQPLQEMAVAISGVSAASSTINGAARQRRRVRLHADTACFVTWGDTPAALSDGSEGRPLGAENPEYFDIEAGHKIAVIERL